ncbi:hypothetical protein AB6A40_003146 [Gnathostoma spinigerum]|uniref:Uncharacterized protein n=1 Tax=Gnathostoma spinigerum TaxID=75299 RepID=A0ABD6EAY7_9BILA
MSMPAESLTCTRSKGLSSLSSPSLSRSRGNRHSTRTRERRRSQQQLWSVFAAALPHSSSDTVERITEIPAKVSSGQEQGRCSTVRGSKICDYLPSTSGRSTGKHSRHKPPRKLAVANVKNFCDREDDREQRDQAQELISSVIPSYGKGCNSFLQSLPRTELRRDASPSASSTASSGVCSTESCRNSIVSDSVLSSAKERSLRHFSVPVTDSGESSESSINESDQPAVLPGLKSSCPFEVPYSPEQLWYIHEWYVARCSAVDSSSQCRQKLCRNRRSRQRQQGKHAVNSTRGMWMSQQRNAESYNKFMGIYGSYNRGITPAITTSPNIFLLTASGYENYFPVDGIQTSLATETTCYFPRPATAVSGISPSSSYSVSSSPCTDTVRDVKPVVITHIEPSSEITPNEKELEKLASRPAYGASHALNVHSVSADDKGIYTTLTVGNSTALVRVGGVSADEPSPPQVLQLTSDSRIGPSLLGVSIPKGHPQSCASTFSVPHSSENRMGRIAVSEQSQQQLPSTSYSRRHPKVYLNLKKCASPLSTSADSCTSNADVMTGSSAMEDRFDTAPVSSLSAKNSDDVVPKPRPLPPANPSRKRLIDGDKENFATPSPECQCRELSFESDDEIGLIDDITESNHDVLQNKAKEFHVKSSLKYNNVRKCFSLLLN